MGSCIAKPHRRHSAHLLSSSHSHTPSAISVPPEVSNNGSEPSILAVSEEGDALPFHNSMEYSQSELEEHSEDSESEYSLGPSIRDSLEFLRDGKLQKQLEQSYQADLEEKETEILHLKSQIEALKNVPRRELICQICLVSRPKVVFRPCRHLCCCDDCAKQAELCPVCDTWVAAREEVFV